LWVLQWEGKEWRENNTEKKKKKPPDQDGQKKNHQERQRHSEIKTGFGL